MIFPLLLVLHCPLRKPVQLFDLATVSTIYALKWIRLNISNVFFSYSYYLDFFSLLLAAFLNIPNFKCIVLNYFSITFR